MSATTLLNHALQKEFLEKYPFFSLVQPFGGIISDISSLHEDDYAGPSFSKALAHLSSLTAIFPQVLSSAGDSVERSQLGGAGSDEYEEMALVRAVAEAAERYACCVFSEDEVIVASAKELGDEALSFERYSRCSEREYADPRCILSRFDPESPIRWVRGLSVTDGRERLVPLVMTHLYIREWDGEHFWHPISTGVAAHTDPVRAIVSAINEVIERDAIALTWLLRIPLPRIVLDESAPAELTLKFHRLKRSKIKQLFFDATTDVGIPTVYGLQLTEGHARISQFVNCSCGFSVWDNCAKIIRESACGRIAIGLPRELPESIEHFYALEHGASFMGRPEHRPQFDFLAKTPHATPISTMPRAFPSEPKAQYHYLTKRLAEMGMEVVLVDLTTDELRDAGLWVVRAVIPALVPMSCVYRSRYLGHPRIYEYARRIGAEIQREEDINSWPQPFA